MNKCLQLAKLGEYYVAPNPMVGAVLVESPAGDLKSKVERVVGEGWHKEFGGPHAEVNCFRDAEERGILDFSNCTLFVSLEPCSHYGKTPPCANLIVEKGVKKVVVGMNDPNPLVAGKGIEILQKNGIEVVVGVMEDECRELNKRFLMLHENHRPYVILKWAQTKDGYIDRLRPPEEGQKTKAQEPLVISTPVTKQLVHKMRAENMAIMVGTNTVLKDNPKLNVTRWAGRNPIRVTVDRHNRLQATRDRKIFDESAPTIVYRDNTDWDYIVHDLAERGIHSILVEGGTTLLNHILQTGIYDEIHVEVAGTEIGEGVAAPEIKLPEKYEEIDNHRLYKIMKKISYVLFIALVLTLSGCRYIRNHQADGVAAEVAGQKLYETEVGAIVGNLTGEDSIRVRNEYIHQWVIDNLVQDKASEYITPQIERLVADYRRSLCVYEYEKELVRARMSTHVADSVLTAFYESHQDRLKLQDDIFKGLLIIIPQDAPQQEALNKSLNKLEEDDLQFIERYAYQNATGYELFLDEWRTANQLLVHMPFERNTLISELQNKQQIVLQDSLNKYILHVTDKCLKGNKKPFDYAKTEIEKIILSQRQNTFMKQEHERLYNEGIQSKKVKIYE